MRVYVCDNNVQLSFQPGDFVHTLGDAHVYLNHIEPLQEQVGIMATTYTIVLLDSLFFSSSGSLDLFPL